MLPLPIRGAVLLIRAEIWLHTNEGGLLTCRPSRPLLPDSSNPFQGNVLSSLFFVWFHEYKTAHVEQEVTGSKARVAARTPRSVSAATDGPGAHQGPCDEAPVVPRLRGG